MPSFGFHIRPGNHSSHHNVDLPDARAAHKEATMIFGDMARGVAAQLNETPEWANGRVGRIREISFPTPAAYGSSRMSNDDEYRRQAAAAEKQARLAKFDSDRESWLRIAQGWLSLLSMRPQSEDEAFSAQSKADGTGQDGSESSN